MLICAFLKNNIVNAERRGKRQVLIRPSSKVIVKFLSVMQRHGMQPAISSIHPQKSHSASSFAGYIGEFEQIDDHRSGKIVVQLNGRLNKTGVISPRFNVQVNQIESWVNVLLPARGFGIIILVSTYDTLTAHHKLMHGTDDLRWYPRPRRGTSQKCWWKASGLRLLNVHLYLPLATRFTLDKSPSATRDSGTAD